MATRAKLFSQLAKSVDASGTITSDGISSTVSLGATVYDSIGELPMSGYTAGEQAFVKSTSRLYINSGVGWYNVAVINNTPTIQSILDSDDGTTPFTLSSIGDVTRITITAQDSDGDALTYTASADSDFNGLATISQVSNVFTITPLSQDSATTSSGTITFNVTDNINIANSVQTFTLNFLSALWDETTLSIGTSSTNSLDNSTFIDRSTNAHTVTPTGTPVQTAFHPYLDNWGVSLQSDTAYVTIADDPTLNLTGEFTIEVWYKQYSYGTNNGRVFQRGANSITGYCLLVRDDGTVKFGRTDEEIVGYNQNLSDGQWHHHAVTRDASNNVRIFFDGVLKDTATLSDSLTQSGALHIGAFPGGTSTNRVDGDFSNFRLVTGSALYTSNFTPSTTPLTDVSGTQVLTLQDNRFVDNSSNNLTVTPANGAAIIPSSPFGQGSEYTVGENKGAAYFDGSGDYLSVANDASLNVLGSSFTIECWFNLSEAQSDAGLVSKHDGSAGYIIRLDTTFIRFYTTAGTIDRTYSFNQGEWHHVAVVSNGTTGTMYINGVAQGATFSTNGTNATSALQIGQTNTVTNDFDGYITDVRITNTVVYTSNFTPPTAPVGNTNADLYLPMDNAGVFDKTGLNTLTPVGNTSTSTTQTKFADTAMYFDGTGDYVSIIGGPFNIQQNWTIETWIWPSSVSGARTIVGYDQADGSNFWDFRLNGTSFEFRARVSGADDTTSGGTVSASVWSHLAAVNINGTIKLYLNGTEIASNVASLPVKTTDKVLGIGANLFDGRDYFNGYIENLQIFKGVAKYTSNFTPPTQEQGRTYQAES